MYSVTAQSSFDMISIVYDKIVDFCGVKDVPCVIVGSKMDLKDRFVTVSRLQTLGLLTLPMIRIEQPSSATGVRAGPCQGMQRSMD